MAVSPQSFLIQKEIITAIEAEREQQLRTIEFRVEACHSVGPLLAVTVEPSDDRYGVDESLEGLTARWDAGHANVLSVVPSKNLLYLRFATREPKTGQQLEVVPIDYLEMLLIAWRQQESRTPALTWLSETDVNQCAEFAPKWQEFDWLRTRQREAFGLLQWSSSFLEGPPGTGKTTLLGCVLAQTLMQYPECRVLLLSITNTAVDEALLAVDKAFDQLGSRGLDIANARKCCKRFGVHFNASRFINREYLLPPIDEEIVID